MVDLKAIQPGLSALRALAPKFLNQLGAHPLGPLSLTLTHKKVGAALQRRTQWDCDGDYSPRSSDSMAVSASGETVSAIFTTGTCAEKSPNFFNSVVSVMNPVR